MICGKCGGPIQVTTSFCTFCGNPVPAEQRALLPQTTSVSIPPPSPTWNTLKHAGAIAYLAFVFVFFTVHWEGREENWAGAVGFEIGTALIPAVIVLLYYKKRKRPVSSARVISVLASWIILANLISIHGSRPTLTVDDIPVIAKEAAGLVPISNADDPGRTVLRDYFKELIALNKDYLARVHAINFDALYTPQSYLDPKETKAVISQLDLAGEIDQAQEDALGRIVERCKARIGALDWSEDYKKNFLTGFDDKYQQALITRRPVVASAKEWRGSVRDLYMFVLNNQQYFHRYGGNVRIARSDVLKEFNQKIEHINDLTQKHQAAKKLFKEKGDEDLGKLGLSAHDLGRD